MDSLFEKESDFTICGIDEAGRGPLAGPLVVAGVILTREISGLQDSKRLSEKQRELLYSQIIVSSKYHISIVDSEYIDKNGISSAIKRALNEIIEELRGDGVTFLFDGNSSYGIEGLSHMVKADTKVAQVSAASILAKVTRDRLMVDYAKMYPEYGFDRHKGYGTKAHIEPIRESGYTPIHRKSYRIKSW